MKNLFIVLFLLNSLLCFSQNELEVNLSYDRVGQVLLIKLKNQTGELLGLDKGMEAPKVYDGSVFYIANMSKDKYNEDEMFALMEYDEVNSKFKRNIYRRIIWMQPHEEKCFAVSVKEKSKLLKSDYVFVEIRLVITIPPTKKEDETEFKEFSTGVYKISLNE